MNVLYSTEVCSNIAATCYNIAYYNDVCDLNSGGTLALFFVIYVSSRSIETAERWKAFRLMSRGLDKPVFI